MEAKGKFYTLRSLFQKYPVWQEWWYVYIWDKIYNRNSKRWAWVSSTELTWTDSVWFTNTINFTAVSNNQVDWSSWNIYLWNWDSYSVPSWTTWRMTWITYIYLDMSSSTLGITNSWQNAVWKDKIVVCVAKPSWVVWKLAEFQAFWSSSQSVFITWGNIAANSITANEIDVNYVYTNTLDASQITTGFLSSNRIAAGSITASKIASHTITANEIAANTITANEISSSYIYTNTLDASQITTGFLSASRIAAGSISASQVNFTYAGSSSQWWAINQWFTTNGLSSVTSPNTWVKIDSTWIRMYSWWVEKVSITSSWNATFEWTIQASTINWWTITWWAISWWTITWTSIDWSTITWWTIQTANSWARIILDSLNWLRVFDISNNIRLRLDSSNWFSAIDSSWWTRINIPISWDVINFYDSWWTQTWKLEWKTISNRPVVWWPSSAIYNSIWAIVADTDLIAMHWNAIVNWDFYWYWFYPWLQTTACYTSSWGWARPYWSSSSYSWSILYNRWVYNSTATATRKIEVDIWWVIYYLLATT
jgi:hypothetical protein